MADVSMESEEGQEEFSSYYKPSYVLIAVDTHCTMFQSEGQPTPFKNCMNALYRLSDTLLLKSDKRGWSPFSVHLFDKEEKATLINFKDNMIETTKLLKQKSKLSEDDLKNQYMRNYDLDLAAFFQYCKRKFRDVSSTFYKRILIFITNDPDPVCGDASKRFTAFHEAKNFEENDIAFQLVVSHEDFKYDKFYTELLSLLHKPEEICEDEEALFEKIASTILFRHSQRKLCFYPFADDLEKYITLFRKSYIQYQRLLNNDHFAADGTELKKVTQNAQGEDVLGADPNYVLCNTDDRKTFDIDFDVAEKVQAETKVSPIGYVLLYVCDRLRGMGEVVTEPRILEADSKEELPYFKQFWQYCVNNKKVLVCSKVLRKGDSPEPVELIPKLIHGNKVFLEKDIAYADEFFEPEHDTVEAGEIIITDEQKCVTDNVINRLTFQFQSSFLVDDSHLKKVEFVKSKLLEEDRREVDAKDLLTVKEIDERLCGVLEDFLKCFPPEQGVKRKRSAPLFKKPTPDSPEPASKKTKKSQDNLKLNPFSAMKLKMCGKETEVKEVASLDLTNNPFGRIQLRKDLKRESTTDDVIVIEDNESNPIVDISKKRKNEDTIDNANSKKRPKIITKKNRKFVEVAAINFSDLNHSIFSGTWVDKSVKDEVKPATQKLDEEEQKWCERFNNSVVIVSKNLWRKDSEQAVTLTSTLNQTNGKNFKKFRKVSFPKSSQIIKCSKIVYGKSNLGIDYQHSDDEDIRNM